MPIADSGTKTSLPESCIRFEYIPPTGRCYRFVQRRSPALHPVLPPNPWVAVVRFT